MKKSDITAWFKRFIKTPVVVAAVVSGVLIVFGVPAPVATQVGTAIGASADAVEQAEQTDRENLQKLIEKIEEEAKK